METKRTEIEKVQVCFNLLDPDQLALYERVKAYPNQSGYIKRLIQRDVLMGTQNGLQEVTRAAAILPSQEDDFALEGFI